MKPGPWLRARQGLLAGLGLVLLLLGLAHLANDAFLARETRQAEDAAVVDSARNAEAARLTLLRTLDAVQALVQVTRERAALAAQGNAEGVAALETLARQVARRRAFGILQVATIGADGRVVWSSQEGWQPVDLSDRAHFRAHLPGPDGIPPDRLYISEPLLGRVSNQTTVQASRVVLDAAGRFAGVTVISLDPFDLSRLLAELLPDAVGVISVLRDDGVFLARSRDAKETVGRRLKPDSPALALLQAGRDGDIRTIGSLGGRDIFSAVRRVPESPIYVSANISVGSATAATERLRTILRAGEAALALLGFGAVWLVRQWQQRRRGMAALAAAEATQRELARVLEGLPGAAFRGEVEPDGTFRFLYGSPAINEMTGMRRAALQTLHDWAQHIEAMDPPGKITDLPLQAVREGRAAADLLFRRPDGTRRWLRTTLQPMRGNAAGTVELIGYTSDVTEQREALSTATNASKLAMLGEMATGLAHELNQPVSIMALAAENAARALDRRGAAAIPDARQRMERIGQLAQRAKGIIDHLRAFGRTDPGALEPVSVAEAMAGAGMLCGASLREAEVALLLDLPEDLPPVRGRLMLLEQVLINLLLNARDAMLAAGTPGRRITVAARAEAGLVVVTVTDTGPGIPETVLPRLFEPFFTTKPTGQGTGLGLSLCHGIMRSFGGGITAGNAPGEGAAFRLTMQPSREYPANLSQLEDVSR